MSSSILEQKYVYDTYQKIAELFSITRSYLWKSVRVFLDEIETGSIIVEVGSGNGKNLLYRKDCMNIGIDLCENFCKISQKKGIDSTISNGLRIPLIDNSIDYMLSIAVIHHLSTEERRFEALKELVRCLCFGGKLMVQVWALKQSEKYKNKFKKQDNLVRFQNSTKTVCEYRFYHVFYDDELLNMAKKILNIKILKYYWECGNWILIIQKNIP